MRFHEVIKGLILFFCHGMLHFSELKFKMLVSGAGGPEPPFFAWSRSRFFCLEPEPETSPGPLMSGARAAQKSLNPDPVPEQDPISFLKKFETKFLFWRIPYIIYPHQKNLKKCIL